MWCWDGTGTQSMTLEVVHRHEKLAPMVSNMVAISGACVRVLRIHPNDQTAGTSLHRLNDRYTVGLRRTRLLRMAAARVGTLE